MKLIELVFMLALAVIAAALLGDAFMELSGTFDPIVDALDQAPHALPSP